MQTVKSDKSNQMSADSIHDEVKNHLNEADDQTEDADDDEDARSDGSEELSVELVKTTEVHECNFDYMEDPDGKTFYLVVRDITKIKQQRRAACLKVPEYVIKPGVLTLDQQKICKYRCPGTMTGYWIFGGEKYFSQKFMDETETKPCHQDMHRMQDLICRHPQSLELPQKQHKEGAGLIHLGPSIEQGHGSI